jgi:hypothetical protein
MADNQYLFVSVLPKQIYILPKQTEKQPFFYHILLVLLLNFCLSKNNLPKQKFVNG